MQQFVSWDSFKLQVALIKLKELKFSIASTGGFNIKVLTTSTYTRLDEWNLLYK